MTVIQFKPSAWSEEKNIQNKKTNYQTIQTSFPLDSFQYKDEIIDEPQSFIERIKAFFNIEKTSTQKANSLTSEAAYDKASLVLSEALLNKKELTWLIFKGVQNDYEDIYNHAGNLVTFAQDHLGRGVMTEHDQKDKPIRITTFALSDGSIYRIEEKIPNSFSYNKTVFFNYDDSHIEIQKRISGDKVKELYSFEKGIPKVYKKDCKMTSNGAVAKEVYYF